MDATGAMLHLEHVTKRFPGNVRAVDDLTIGVGKGELLVLFGPSGCGKTTTLRMIAGLDEPTQGTIAIGGSLVSGKRPRDRDVAMVFQNYALYSHKTVAGNMAFGLKLRGMGRAEIERRVVETAELLGIRELLGRRPSELSGGQQQRVALGRAMVRRPSVYLLDEPLSNLDAVLRSHMRREIGRLHARLGTTTVYVTHDQTEAMTLGQRIAVLDRGRLQQVADPMSLYDRPANRFVASVIGSPAMNFFGARIQRQGEGLSLVAAGSTGGEASGLCVPLPEAWSRRLAAYEDGPITLGIRPEHLLLATTEPVGCGAQIRMTIEAVEPLGHETMVYGSAAGQPVVVRVLGRVAAGVGERVALTVSYEQMHFFDPHTQCAVGS